MKQKPFLWLVHFFFASSSRAFVWMSLYGLLSAGLAAGAIVFLRSLVDGRGRSGAELALLAIGYLLSALVLPNAFGILNQMYKEQVLRRSQQVLTAQLMRSSAHRRLDRLEDPSYQDLVSAVTKADSGVMMNYWQSVQEVVISGVRIVSVGGVLISFYWGIPLVLCIVILPELWMRMRFAKLQHSLHFDQSAVERRASYFAELLTGREWMKELRTHRVETFLFAKWKRSKDAYDRADFAFDRKRQAFTGIGQLLGILSTMVSMLFMVKWVMSGQTTIGAFTSAIFALNYIMNSIGSLMYNLGQAQHQQLLVETTMNFLQEEAEEQTVAPGLQVLAAPFDIRFERVSYAYPDAELPALQEVSFTISHGERIALVGANGSGKSTLIRLLLGLSRPTSGCIYVNGIPLEECSLVSYRAGLTVAFQDFAQYFRTVRENIGYGHLPSMENQPLLERAAEQSGARAFIEKLPQGYEQQLGASFANGVDLSGGQWQKTAIARAYLRPAACVVMDEPTASLDPVAEVEVYRLFTELAEGKTAVLVSHRLGSATLADRILVLKQGRLVEVGTHAELMERQGEYEKLFSSQAAWYRQTEEEGEGQDERCEVAGGHLQ